MARSFQRSRGSRLARRWLEFSTGTAFMAQGNATTVALVIASPSINKDTVMRTRGVVTGYVDGALATSRASLITIGMIVLQEGVVAAAGAPDPFLDGNADWFYYTQFLLAYEESVTDVISVQAVSGYREVIDSKAMRKSMPDTEIAVVVANDNVSTGVQTNVHIAGRFLVGQ